MKLLSSIRSNIARGGGGVKLANKFISTNIR